MESGGVFGIIGIILGYLLRSFDNWVLGRQDREQRRHDFQRDTLINLQQALYETDRAAAQVAPGRGPNYRGPNDPDPTAVLEDAQHRVNMYRVRLDDDELVDAVKQFYAAAMLQAVGQQTNESMNAKHTNLNRANERIGVLLKALH